MTAAGPDRLDMVDIDLFDNSPATSKCHLLGLWVRGGLEGRGRRRMEGARGRGGGVDIDLLDISPATSDEQ